VLRPGVDGKNGHLPERRFLHRRLAELEALG